MPRPSGAADHFGADGGQEAEDRADHQADDDHRHAIGMRILVKIWSVLAPKERASAILARSTRRKPVAELIITIGPTGERHGNDARLAAKPEASG